MKYLSPEDVLFMHSAVIDETGGSHGVRDLGLLQAALARPRQSFGGKDLYPSLFEKAAALLESLAKNHPFIDGNKRTAITACGVFLELNGYTLNAGQDELAQYVERLAQGPAHAHAIVRWLHSHTSKT